MYKYQIIFLNTVMSLRPIILTANERSFMKIQKPNQSMDRYGTYMESTHKLELV